MARSRFPLDSDQLELLLAFEESKGLGDLAELMAKDPSVVSRSLQRIAEAHPVLVKVRGRWELTPLGKQTNALTQEFLQGQAILLKTSSAKPVNPKPYLDKNSLLIVINAQKGLLDATQEGRNNSAAERNIASLLKHFRDLGKTVMHVKHVSENPGSLFYRHAEGVEFLPEATPHPKEEIIEKSKSSAFTDTDLVTKLKNLEPTHIVLVGFTAGECIDATAKDAAALGFSSYVIGDATAMFDLRNPEGKLIKADRLHKMTLANLNAFHAKVISTSDIIF